MEDHAGCVGRWGRGRELGKASESGGELKQTWKSELKLGRPWRGRGRHSKQSKLLELKKKNTPSMLCAGGVRETAAFLAFIGKLSRVMWLGPFKAFDFILRLEQPRVRGSGSNLVAWSGEH